MLKLPPVSEFEAIKGRGIHAKASGRDVWVGGPRLLELLRVEQEPGIAEFARPAGAKGQTVVYLIQEKKVLAAFALADVIRLESAERVYTCTSTQVQVSRVQSKDVLPWYHQSRCNIPIYTGKILNSYDQL